MKMKLALVAIVLMMTAQSALAGVSTRYVSYRDGEKNLQGFLAYDDTKSEPQPAVLIVHQWRGLGDYAKKRAMDIAKLGYTAFALDMYGVGVKAANNEQAEQLAKPFYEDRRMMRDRALAGLKALASQGEADANNIVAIGYCFGGSTVLELARDGAPVKGVVSFHGGFKTPQPMEPGAFDGKILVLHGAADPYTPMEDVHGLIDELTKAGADWELTLYSDVVHAFTDPGAGDDPSKGVAYDAEADRRSWASMKGLLKAVLGQ